MAGVLKTKYEALKKEVNEYKEKIRIKEEELANEKEITAKIDSEVTELQRVVDARLTSSEVSKERLEETRRLRRTVSVSESEHFHANKALELAGTNIQRRIDKLESELAEANGISEALKRKIEEANAKLQEGEENCEKCEKRFKVNALNEKVDNKHEEIDNEKKEIKKLEEELLELQNF